MGLGAAIETCRGWGPLGVPHPTHTLQEQAQRDAGRTREKPLPPAVSTQQPSQLAKEKYLQGPALGSQGRAVNSGFAAKRRRVDN